MIFPSVEWFTRLGELMEENRAVHEHVGDIDCSCVWTVFDADGQGTDRHIAVDPGCEMTSAVTLGAIIRSFR